MLHIPLASGRVWTHDEIMRGARLAVVNQTLAAALLAARKCRRAADSGPRNSRRIRRIAVAVAGSDGWLQIVGVVSDVRDDGLGKPVKPAIYVPYSMQMGMWTQILVRTRGEPLAILRAVRGESA